MASQYRLGFEHKTDKVMERAGKAVTLALVCQSTVSKPDPPQLSRLITIVTRPLVTQQAAYYCLI